MPVRLASYVILKKGDEVLLTRRANTGFEDGNFSLPCGKLDGDESFSDAAARETLEEIGVTAKGLIPVHILHRRKSEDDLWVDVFFLSEDWEGEPQNIEPDKCDYVGWFSVGSLPKNIVPFVREAIESLRTGKFYSEYGWMNINLKEKN
jgi:8-oxo-dGTP diphosphatase